MHESRTDIVSIGGIYSSCTLLQRVNRAGRRAACTRERAKGQPDIYYANYFLLYLVFLYILCYFAESWINFWTVWEHHARTSGTKNVEHTLEKALHRMSFFINLQQQPPCNNHWQQMTWRATTII